MIFSEISKKTTTMGSECACAIYDPVTIGLHLAVDSARASQYYIAGLIINFVIINSFSNDDFFIIIVKQCN